MGGLRAEQAESKAQEAEARLESLIQQLRNSGIDPDTFLRSPKSEEQSEAMLFKRFNEILCCTDL
jgi:translation initiation factor IF-2